LIRGPLLTVVSRRQRRGPPLGALLRSAICGLAPDDRGSELLANAWHVLWFGQQRESFALVMINLAREYGRLWRVVKG
jgi:hypothetical protein